MAKCTCDPHDCRSNGSELLNYRDSREETRQQNAVDRATLMEHLKITPAGARVEGHRFVADMTFPSLKSFHAEGNVGVAKDDKLNDLINQLVEVIADRVASKLADNAEGEFADIATKPKLANIAGLSSEWDAVVSQPNMRTVTDEMDITKPSVKIVNGEPPFSPADLIRGMAMHPENGGTGRSLVNQVINAIRYRPVDFSYMPDKETLMHNLAAELHEHGFAHTNGQNIRHPNILHNEAFQALQERQYRSPWQYGGSRFKPDTYIGSIELSTNPNKPFILRISGQQSIEVTMREAMDRLLELIK